MNELFSEGFVLACGFNPFVCLLIIVLYGLMLLDMITGIFCKIFSRGKRKILSIISSRKARIGLLKKVLCYHVLIFILGVINMVLTAAAGIDFPILSGLLTNAPYINMGMLLTVFIGIEILSNVENVYPLIPDGVKDKAKVVINFLGKVKKLDPKKIFESINSEEKGGSDNE